MGSSHGKMSMPDNDFGNVGNVLDNISDAFNDHNSWDNNTGDAVVGLYHWSDYVKPPAPPSFCCGGGTGSLIEEDEIIL